MKNYSVYNTELGRAFISDLRKVLRKGGWCVTLRGRGSNRKRFAFNSVMVRRLARDLPLKLSSHYSVYLRRGKGKKAGLSYEMALGACFGIQHAYLMNHADPFVKE